MTQYGGYWGPKSPFKKIELPVYTDESALELAFDNGTVDTIVAALPSSSLDKYAKAGGGVELLPADPAGRPGDGELRATSSSRTSDARVAFLKSIDQGDAGEPGPWQALRGGHHDVRQGHDPRMRQDKQVISFRCRRAQGLRGRRCPPTHPRSW